MIKSKIVLPIIFTLIFVALFLSCDPSASEPGDLEKTGTLIIRVGEGGTGRSIEWEPDVLMEIDSYEIAGIGPEGRTFGAVKAEKGERVVISNLREGNWSIIVTGFNKDNQAIGEGVESVTILAGREVEKRIVVTEFKGEGTFSLEVNWPEQEVTHPNILITLNNPTSGELIKYTFAPEGGEEGATSVKEIEAGYYLLTLSIYDGPTDDINNKLTGVSGTVRILANYTTLGLFTFDKDDLRVFGDVEISISDGLSLPFELTLNQDRSSVWEGVPITFTATPNIGGDFVYYWYLNGELLEGENSDTLHLEETLPYGKNYVGVAASRQGVLASKLTSFMVIEEPQTYFTVRIFEEGTNTLAQQFDLNYTVPDVADLFYPDNRIEEGYFKLLEFRSIIYEEEGEIIFQEFIINAFDKIPENGVFLTDTVIEDFTLAVVYIEDFVGEGVYQFPIKDNGQSTSMFGIMTSQIEIDGYSSLGMLVSLHNEAGGAIEIIEFGDVGGFVKGEIEIQKVPMSFYYEDSDEEYLEYFNLEAKFLISRSEDFLVTEKTITFVFEENNVITRVVLTGKIYESLLREIAYECMTRAPDNGVIIGWSLEEINGEEAYEVYDAFLVPDSDLTLYAIWEDFD